MEAGESMSCKICDKEHGTMHHWTNWSGTCPHCKWSPWRERSWESDAELRAAINKHLESHSDAEWALYIMGTI